MSERSPSDAADSEYESWSIDSDKEYTYVGVIGGRRVPVLFAPEDNRIHEAEVDTKNRHLIPKQEVAWEVAPKESLGDTLERIGDETGWDSLSEFARDHLQEES